MVAFFRLGIFQANPTRSKRLENGKSTSKTLDSRCLGVKAGFSKVLF
jgi:hypothetical protein